MEKQNEIAKLAYELYVASGCKEGRDLDNWLEAENVFAAKQSLEEKTEFEFEKKEIAPLQKEPEFEEHSVVL